MRKVQFRLGLPRVECNQRNAIESEPGGTTGCTREGFGALTCAAPARGPGRLLAVAGVLLATLVMLSGCVDHVIRGAPVGKDASGQQLYRFCYDVCRYGNCETDAFCKVKTHACELQKAMIPWPCSP